MMSKTQACLEVGRQAGWDIPPDWADPFVVDMAFRAAIARNGGMDDALRIAAESLRWTGKPQ